jgi:hypothetical protein
MKQDITELFCFVDDFCKAVNEYMNHSFLPSKIHRRPTRVCKMTISEMVTILLLYHQSPCKNFKFFYKSYLQLYRSEFPKLVSYNRFIQLKPRILFHLIVFVQWFCHQSQKTGISYMDSSSLVVCHPKRIKAHKVFKGIAKLGKTTKGWFLGLKIHLVINERGDLHAVQFTPGNVDDRTPVINLVEGLLGFLFADKGYIKKELFETLYAKGLKLVTGIKTIMKNKLMPWMEKILLRKRTIIESVFHILKDIFELEHTRHRSVPNAFVHFASTLLAYCFKNNKPAIKRSYLIQN